MKWIINPVCDLVFCCGGLIWLLCLAHCSLILFDPSARLLMLFSACVEPVVHGFSEPHIAATLHRSFGNTQLRRRFFLHQSLVSALVLGLLVLGLTVQGFIGVLLKIYFLWVIQHFTAQSYGLVLLYCYKNNYALSQLDKRILSALMNCTALLAVVRQLSSAEFAPAEFLGQQIPVWGVLPIFAFHLCSFFLQVAILLFVFRCVANYFSLRKIFPIPALLIIITSIAIFATGTQLFGVLYLYAPAFFHAAQYLVLTLSCHLKGERDKHSLFAEKTHGESCIIVCLNYYLLLLLISALVFLVFPAILRTFGVSYQFAFANVFCIFGLHHFATDATIWKLRDPQVRKSVVV